MSATASRYSAGKLYGGIAVAALVEILSFGTSSPLLLNQSKAGRIVLLVTSAHGLMMFASSFVEEEHQYWYFIASAWFLWLGMKQWVRNFKLPAPMTELLTNEAYNGPWSAVLAVTPLATMRIVRAWNQTGQKHAGQPDITKALSTNHNYLLWVLVSMIYFSFPASMIRPNQSQSCRRVSILNTTVLSAVAFAFKVAFTMADAPELLKGIPIAQRNVFASVGLTTQARILFSGMLLFCAGVLFPNWWTFTRKRSDNDNVGQVEKRLQTSDDILTARLMSLHGVLTLFLMTQSRVTNIPLFALFELQLQTFARMDLSAGEISLTSIILQYASFFAFGGSNSISSIDLSNGYNGISGYNVAVVGILTFCSNWAGPIWWSYATMMLLARSKRDRSDRYWHFHHFSTHFVANSVLFIMLACAALRTHLFVWTVFSPKYLFVVAWSLGQHLLVNTSFIGLFLLLDVS